MGWGSGNLGGSGGGLNFAVKQYTETPTGTAKENTIGVVTDTAIAGWVMQAEQPEGVEGLVWIEVAAASDVAFYVDKKQRVKLYPKSVKQYVSGAWASVDAYVYQGGPWVEFSSIWNGEIYKNGNQYESLTGGWSAYAQENGSVVFEDDRIALNFSVEGSNRVLFSTNNKIDLTGYNSLVIKIDHTTITNEWGLWFFIANSKLTTNISASAIASIAVRAVGETVLDISSFDGEAYVCFGNSQSRMGTFYISEIRMVS